MDTWPHPQPRKSIGDTLCWNWLQLNVSFQLWVLISRGAPFSTAQENLEELWKLDHESISVEQAMIIKVIIWCRNRHSTGRKEGLNNWIVTGLHFNQEAGPWLYWGRRWSSLDEEKKRYSKCLAKMANSSVKYYSGYLEPALRPEVSKKHALASNNPHYIANIKLWDQQSSVAWVPYNCNM